MRETHIYKEKEINHYLTDVVTLWYFFGLFDFDFGLRSEPTRNLFIKMKVKHPRATLTSCLWNASSSS